MSGAHAVQIIDTQVNNEVIMKKILFLASLLMASLSAFGFDKIEEGVHYTVIKNAKPSDSPKLTEMFSLYCPHCLALEQFLKPAIEKLPEGTKFERSHVSFISGYSRDMQKATSKAYIYKNMQGEGENFVARMFTEAQKKGIRINTQERFNTALANAGLNVERSVWFENETVEAELKKMEDRQMNYLDVNAITGVPSLIVNDKYVVKISSIRKEDPVADLASVISQLLEME